MLPAADSTDGVRIIVFVDHEPLGANPGATDILEAAAWLQPYNKDKVGSRFKILVDKIYGLENSAATVTSCIRTFDFRIPLKFVTYYQSDAGTVADVLKNNVGFLAISSAGVPNLSFTGQFCYKDL